ncbi:hypothetical protein ALNOE001_08240 [Candidatus Methanobinarius endosymbioticus]|uniref:Right handed beta helix domain-containing protein n=1 Tax=Candidatus Methanobinarius endosymbioticus TaxID=2006182 RepID=A0A366MD19_9EURY|nr:hypothetical protein ALNOE001_08240 [Candidatus Methanobinarius endosymbioticus]
MLYVIGGAIFSEKNNITIIGSEFIKNKATRGAGVFFASDSNSNIINSTFINNSAINNESNVFGSYNVNNDGGAIYSDYGSTINIIGTNLIANFAKDYGEQYISIL